MSPGVARFLRRWVLPFADPRQLASFALVPGFLLELRRYRRLSSGEIVRWGDAWPCLLDRVSRTPFDPHYFYQGAWLARRLAETRPPLHVDVGSSVMMVNMLSAAAKTVFVDYRPLPVRLSNLHPVAGDITRLPFTDACLPSLSCLHVIEHIGLGRYGGPLDSEGSRKGAADLARVLKPGGRLYLSVPVGRERVCFNAHRVFDPLQFIGLFPGLVVSEFSFVDDEGRLHEHQKPEGAHLCDYACGLYILEKR
jgi:SAM-dependent methyltransferase